MLCPIPYIDASGNVVASYVYDAFGNTVAKDGPMANEFHMRFATRYYDDESQLYYFGKRFYSPRLSRWMSRDPEGEDGGLNLYVSCHNDMVNNVDPLGTYTLADAPGWDVLWGHQPHDVATWELARDLGRIPDYYSVRPSW